MNIFEAIGAWLVETLLGRLWPKPKSDVEVANAVEDKNRAVLADGDAVDKLHSEWQRTSE